ncbi:5-oxoprolinase-like [Biomphalaria glabrata]|uniref:5-oxoprolinase-like n=1 Tax=Biomphalaria glabrata TaxID=6526 RepID=A0A9W3AU16_BIOGL|nr:5-oxoprolinase-like [Biomphalaria glabrata]
MDGFGKFQFAIDRGGTFTDIWAKCPNGKVRLMKLLSEDPANYDDAPKEAIRRIIHQETQTLPSKDSQIDTRLIDWIRMGTTVATNALLERKGERMALLITKGFRDLLHIGNQSRPNIFDLEIVCPENLYEDVIEVEERVVLHQMDCELDKHGDLVQGSTGEKLLRWKPVALTQLKKDLQTVLDKGIKSLAVVFMHSYIFCEHEESVGRLAQEMGFTNVSLSSKVMCMARIVPRGYTACADAYLTPCIKKYVNGFSSGLQDAKILFMQSDGGLTPMASFMGSHAILSGPAGGVVGYAETTFDKDSKVPVIGFDMGGTSTDVSRFAGEFEHVFETTTAGITIQAPQLDINTVAAGGGSMLFFRSGMFVVGPESAGAHPGPVCYMKGGPLTITDANLCLGRLLPEYFPRIFGKTEDMPLDKAATLKAFEDLTHEVNLFLKCQHESQNLEFVPMTKEQVSLGFISVANEAMCRPIRALTQAKGYDTSRHVLACFGGAGGQHACAIARSLGMKEVFIHRYAGILSAYGMALADVVYEAQEPAALIYASENFQKLDERIASLEKKCFEELEGQGFQREQIETHPYLHLRYEGTDCALMCPNHYPATANTSSYGDFSMAFVNRYQTEFGFTLRSRNILVDNIRVRGVGKSLAATYNLIQEARDPPQHEQVVHCYFEEGCLNTSVFLLDNLLAGHVIKGPAIIIDKNSTILVEPNCTAAINKHGNVNIKVESLKKRVVGTDLDAIQLSIFSHRFMSTAEQMGRALQRTSISTNIKERLDFSCAMFGPDGGLVANAPHIPVHLGAMQETVQYQIKTLGDNFKDGDVILSNHPEAGGSHLPDLTVITPVFFNGQPKPVFFVASRGHHADIGGITPGSMPPHSTSIFQEGAVFKSFKLVENGEFKEQELIKALQDPAKYPGSKGSRNLQDNISDLKAQVAANHKGIKLITELITEYGLEVVQAYMKYIQENAEVAVKEMLKEIGRKTKAATGRTEIYAEDFMDHGSRICLHINIDENEGTALFDFTGTGHQVYGNTNAPRAITLSAIIYCMRCMVGHDVPLNQGCLAPIKVIMPKGSLIDPSEEAAVVGGNVLTSQRIVDVVLKAFGVCAASQGCMNNITFGDERIGYYETVAGGAGAGPTWHGRSGVHTHMTNTRITDPEILEKRYPVIVQCFKLNPGSGGRGLYNGGDGVIRELLFRRPVTLSLLTERRVFSPYGLEGGENGHRGQNLLVHADGRVIDLGGKNSITVKPGDVFHLETPGGGGYGKRKLDSEQTDQTPSKYDKKEIHGPHILQSGSLLSYKLLQESA